MAVLIVGKRNQSAKQSKKTVSSSGMDALRYIAGSFDQNFVDGL